MLADRFPPSRVFLVCSLLGAAVNAATLLANGQLAVLLVLRFAVGFLLAGIYPVGMKIAASWYRERPRRSDGCADRCAGAGHCLATRPARVRGAAPVPRRPGRPWCSASRYSRRSGGLPRLCWCPPIRMRRGARRITPRALGLIWSDRRLRASVFGYFGHMWELYAFFVLVPFVVATRLQGTAVSAGAFWAIARGCRRLRRRRAAGAALWQRPGGADAAGLQRRVLPGARPSCWPRPWGCSSPGCCCGERRWPAIRRSFRR